MSDVSSDKYVLLNQLLDEFVARYHRGEHPSLQEYLDRFPDLADDIREAFPALIEIEQVKCDRRAADVPCPAVTSMAPVHIDDFRILREVGRGGMGIVYEAEQVSLGRRVALKVLSGDKLRDEQHKRRFEREAKAAAKLHHTNIVPVFGVGEHEGQPYYVMQFIQGLGIDEVLDELRRLRAEGASSVVPVEAESKAEPRDVSAADVARSLLTGLYQKPMTATMDVPPDAAEVNTAAPARPLSDSNSPLSSSTVNLLGQSAKGSQGRSRKATYWESVARIGAQVAHALEHAHKLGIVHRDIKPSNLLLDMQGTVWVADFGLAKIDDQQNLTQTGDILGTLRYMPPEAFEGRADARGDIYALGLTLYELLTYRPAFDERDRPKLIKQVTGADVVRLRKVNRQVPRDLETIVHKAIDREAGRRYATAGELAADLQRFLDDEPIRARRTSALEQLGRWCRRHRAVASLLASVVVLLAVLAVGGTIAALALRQKNIRAESAELAARKKEFEALVSQAKAGRFSRRKGQRFETLQAIREALDLLPKLQLSDDEQTKRRDALRTLAISALLLPDLHLLREVPRSPDRFGYQEQVRGEHYLDGDPQGNIVLYRASDHAELARLRGEGYPTPVAFNPHNEDLIWVYRRNGDGYRLLEWNPSTGSTCVLLEKSLGRDRTHLNLNLTRWAVANNKKGILDIRSFPSFQPVRVLAVGTGGIDFALSPDGRQVAVLIAGYGLAPRRQVRVYDVDSGALVADLAHTDDVKWVEWMPDGHALAAACWNTNEIVLWDVPAKRMLRRFNRQKGGSPDLAINRGGDLMASTSLWAGGLRLWRPRTGQVLLNVPDSSLIASRPYWGATLVAQNYRAADQRQEVWEIVPGLEYRTLTRAPSLASTPFDSISVSPDGRLLAAGTGAGVAVWDQAHAEERAYLPVGRACAWFEPSSGALFTNSAEGLFRWPVVWPSPHVVRFGPPQRWSSRGHFDSTVRGSRDGKTIAVSAFPYLDSLVFHRQPPHTIRLPADRGDSFRTLAVSPDGRWVATCRETGGAEIFDACSGVREKTLAAGKFTICAFSPDGRWLAVSSQSDFAVWEVEGWRRIWTVAGKNWGKCIAFSPDSQVLASETGRGVIRLREPATGRDLAQLEDPNQDRTKFFTFSPDGTQLIAASNDNQTIHVWDLRAIRRQLAELGLDWDAPAYPPAPEQRIDTADPPPLTIQVNRGDWQDDAVLGARPTAERLYTAIAMNSLHLLFNPADFKALRQRGRAYGCLSQLLGHTDAAASAIADYSAALKLLPLNDPAAVDLLCRRAANHLHRQELDLCFADLDRAQRLDAFRAVLLRQNLAAHLSTRAADAARRKDFAAALVWLRNAAKLDPENPQIHNNLAWQVLVVPAALRDAAEALTHARKAVALAPDLGTHHNTLGVALYRNGQFVEAVPALEKSLQAASELTAAYDLIFLAMCHHRLGERAKARDYLDRADHLLREHKAALAAVVVEELAAFQMEASDLLASPQ